MGRVSLLSASAPTHRDVYLVSCSDRVCQCQHTKKLESTDPRAVVCSRPTKSEKKCRNSDFYFYTTNYAHKNPRSQTHHQGPVRKQRTPNASTYSQTTPCPDTEPSCFRNVGHWNTASRDIRVNIPHTQGKQPIGLHKDGPTSAKPLPYQENPRLEVHTKGDGRSAIGRRGSNQPSSCVTISALLAALVGILFYGVFGVVFL